MTIEELIEELERIKAQRGDNVRVKCRRNDMTLDIDGIRFRNEQVRYVELICE